LAETIDVLQEPRSVGTIKLFNTWLTFFDTAGLEAIMRRLLNDSPRIAGAGTLFEYRGLFVFSDRP
jgi:hypothetical protein